MRRVSYESSLSSSSVRPKLFQLGIADGADGASVRTVPETFTSWFNRVVFMGNKGGKTEKGGGKGAKDKPADKPKEKSATGGSEYLFKILLIGDSGVGKSAFPCVLCAVYCLLCCASLCHHGWRCRVRRDSSLCPLRPLVLTVPTPPVHDIEGQQ